MTTYCRTINHLAVQQLITILPAVPIEQNGSGIAATRRDYFDQYGNLTWTMDERGYLSRMTYDIPSGAMLGTEKGTGPYMVIHGN